MTFDVILEDNWTNKLTFATVEDCKDMDDLIDHIHAEFPSHTIETIKEVANILFDKGVRVGGIN